IPSLFSPPLPPLFFFFHDPPPTELYTLSLHDALPISRSAPVLRAALPAGRLPPLRRPGVVLPIHIRIPAFGIDRHAGDLPRTGRSEEHTSELQSRGHLVCRLLLEKKKK